MARTTGAATDLITFSRASSGTALTKVAYGPELVTNGGFDTDSDWVLPVGASISNGTVILENVGTGQQIYQSYVLPVGVYEYTFDLVSITSGAIQPYIHGAVGGIGIVRGTAGTYTETFVITTAGSRIAFRPNNTTSAVVDNVSVKQVLFNDPTGTLKLISHPTNKPRVEYDANGVAKGLLIEEARTNLITYSENFTVGAWGKTNVTVTANAGISPDGTASATKMVEGTTTQFNFINFAVTLGAAAHTFSAYLKAAERTTASFFLSQGGNNGATFDLLAGTVSSVVGTGNTATIESVGNGWYRCSVTNDGSLDITDFVRIGVQNGAYSSYLGDGTSGIYIWGAQVESGSFPTSYIPTSGATATRSAEAASVDVSNFGYNQAQGTVVAEFSTADVNATNEMAFSDGTQNNRIMWGLDTTAGRLPYISSGGVNTVALVNNTGLQNNVASKVAIAFASNDVASSLDGQAVATDTSATIPNTITTLNFLSAAGIGTGYQINGHIKSINYYPLRLSDAKLQELTS